MILVTGASGLVGREVVSRLTGQAPVRQGLRTGGSGENGTVRFDFLDSSTFEVALRDVRQVFLLRPPQLARARHDFGPFVAAMQRAAVQQVVFLSVRGAERNPLLPHRRIEKLLEVSGLGWTHLRPNDFMQNFATTHQSDIRDRGEIWAPAGRGRTSFVDVRDVADAVVEVLTKPGHNRQAYTLTGSDAFTLDEVALVLSETLGRQVIYRNPGIPAFLRHIRASGRPLALGLIMTGVYTVARLGLAAKVYPELERLIARPPTALRSFIHDYTSVWQN